MLKMFKMILVTMTLLFAGTASAAVHPTKIVFPKNCHPITRINNAGDLLLNSGATPGQHFYLMANISNQSLLLYHHHKNARLAEHWRSQLCAERWSALAVNDKPVTIQCSVFEPGNIHKMSCRRVLRVCEFAGTQYQSNDLGTYWISQDKRLRVVRREIAKRGIKGMGYPS
jgi:hypothetical protein